MWKGKSYNREQLEATLAKLNAWRENHYPVNPLWNLNKQSIAYYTEKLAVMDEHQLETINV